MRSRSERHFDVQIIGGVVLHENKIAEMRTGEGKTLTIALAAYLNSLEGKGVHIVTVNDYLAKRDSFEMGKIFSFLGLTSGYINNDQNDEERKKNYDCDITYATNSELGFDYLRDNMKYSRIEMVQREHFFSIVDEIDSCLIDEARTPLVISAESNSDTNLFPKIDKIIKILRENDFENAVLAYDRDYLEFPSERVSSFSIMTMNLEMNLLNFIEKPTKEQVDQNLDENGKIRVSMNIFKFTGKYSSDFIMNCPINPLRNEKELPSAIMNMITSSESYMRAIPIAEHVPDLTSKKDIAILEKLIN